MSKKRSEKISTLGSQATSVISVTLVLLIVGLLSCLGTATRRMANAVLGNVSIIVKMELLASPQAEHEVAQRLEQYPFVAEMAYTSADQVLAQEMDANSEILELLGENPYSSEFEVKLAPQYVHPDSVGKIMREITGLAGVDEVISQVDVVSTLRALTQKVAIILSILAVVLLAISLVLIYNTVSIAVYARRFVIRTMQLVGATASFIRWPFVKAGIIWGVVSGIVASALLCCMRLYMPVAEYGVGEFLPWGDIAIVCAGLLVLGVLICGVAAFFATTRYLRASYDTLYTT